MRSFKHFIGGLSAALLPIALFAFGAYMGAFQFLQSPDTAKQALKESGIYEVAVKEALAKAQEGTSSQALIPTDNPEVQKIIGQSIPPSMLEQQADGAIDNIYNWLQGKDSKLQFAINVDQAKTQLADGLATYTQQYVDALPPCTGGEVPDPNQPLQATCKPAGFNSAVAAAKVKQDILANEQFLPSDELSAASVQNDAGQPLEQTWSAVPAVYEQVRWGTYISGAVAVLSAVGVLACSPTLRAGLKRFSLITIIVGAVSALSAWVAGVALGNVGTHLAQETAAALQSSIVKAVTLMTQDVRNWWLGYGLALVSAGAVALVVRGVLGRNQTQATPAPATATTTTTSEPTPATGTPSVSRPTTPINPSMSSAPEKKIQRKLIQ